MTKETLPSTFLQSSGRKKISIEQLLIWAYRDQMVHAAKPEGEPVDFIRNDYSPGWHGSSGHDDVAIDSSMKVAFSAHRDAYAVDRAVRSLGHMRRERSDEELSILKARRIFHDVVLAKDRRATGGAHIDRPDEFVEVVHLSALVRMYAMRGERPFFIADPHYAYEKAGIELHPTKRKPLYCRLRPIGDDPLEVEQLRAKYIVWRATLERLRGDLRLGLSAHDLTCTLPPDVPQGC